MFGCSGEITETPRAAGRPDFHEGRNMSPGRELFPAIRFRFLMTGDKIAAEQADSKRSRILSCREIASPLPGQMRAWSPKMSRVPDLQ